MLANTLTAELRKPVVVVSETVYLTTLLPNHFVLTNDRLGVERPSTVKRF